jgi:hypothetical protein
VFFARPLPVYSASGVMAQQEAGSPAEKSQSSAEASGAATAPAAPPTKKAKKVWTNEDLGEPRGTVSQPAQREISSIKKNSPAKSVDPYVLSLRQQLHKLEAQLADVNKQITDLDNFSKGNTSGNGALQLHKRYSSEPIDAQILKLQDKKKQLESRQQALLDDARNKGIEARQLP